MAGAEAAAPGPPEWPRQCRICLSDDEKELGGFIAPCKCSGSMKYVHVQCLRTWRTQGSRVEGCPRLAAECSVCRSPYVVASDCKRPKALLLLLRFPTTFVTCGGALLLRLTAPWLHRHVAGAALMYVAGPMARHVDLWQPWELQRSAANAAGRWLLSGLLTLLLPALAGHAALALSADRSVVARGSEVMLLLQLLDRVRFIVSAALVRSFEGTRLGQQARRMAAQAIHEFWRRDTLPAPRARRYAPANLGMPLRSQLRGPRLTVRERSFLPFLASCRARTELSMFLAERERYLWWWLTSFLWYWADHEGHAAFLARTHAAGAFVAFCAGPLLARRGITDTQAQAVLYSGLSLLLSAFRGAQVVRGSAVRLSVA